MDKQKILNNTLLKCVRKILWDNPLVAQITKHYSDEKYLKRLTHWNRFEKLDVKNPVTYTQKLQWIKLHMNDPIFTLCADKYAARKFVLQRLGEQDGASILNELYGVYDDADEVRFDELPGTFVLKANHGSGMNLIVPDKNSLNRKKTVKKMRKWLNKNYYYMGREWQYKNIPPKIICEKFLRNKDGTEIRDYKFMCFDGEVFSIWVDYDRHTKHVRNFYDLDGNPQYYVSDEPADYSIPFIKPENYEKMVMIVKKLCRGFRHVRVDLYNVDGQIYFGEMTFTPWGGASYLSPELNAVWGERLKLDSKEYE